MTRFTILVAMGLTLATGCGFDPTDDGPSTIEIGALLPLTGTQSSERGAAEAALDLAQRDANLFLAASEATIRVDVRVENTGGDSATAATALTELSNEGITLVVGPWSAEVLATLEPRARRLGVVLLSPSGAVGALVGKDDAAYHMMPDVADQVPTAVTHWRGRGIEALAILARSDAWGDAAVTEVTQAFVDAGGTIVSTTRYAAVGGADFRTELDEVRAAIDDGIEDFGTTGMAVAMLAFDEGVQILQQASGEDRLGDVAWFGLDGFVRNSDLVADSTAATFAAQVTYTAPMYAGNDVDPTREAAVVDSLTETLGRGPEVEALVAYDSLWLATLALAEVGATRDRSVIDGALRSVARVYNGASGLFDLDGGGSRTGANYALYRAEATTNGFAWTAVDAAD